MAKIVHPTCTGRFYPAEAHALRADVDRFLAAAPPSAVHPRAVIAPHAGYIYSGPIAGAAYKCVQNVADRVERVVLLGTCHVSGVQGLATTSAEAIATPLGGVSVDQAGVERVRTAARDTVNVTVDDDAHRADHALAVQLPFLLAVLGEFSVMPFLVGRCATESAADVLDAIAVEGVALQEETLIVVSSDLSHYLDYDTACRLDRDTADAIIALEPERLDGRAACGYVAVGGLLYFARRHGLRASVLDLRNSGDTAGSRDRVVGYGAFAFA